MAKREFIDKAHLLGEIKKLQKSPWYNCGENDMVVARALYVERKEAVEVVRDLCINDESVITEQEIVEPYIKDVLDEINLLRLSGGFTDYNSFSRIFDFVDNLLSERNKHVKL